jgi:SAM-dependent methyltransferase
MSGFAADWLALREPADQRARDARIIADISQYWSTQGQEQRQVRITDLGCGTGSTLRALSPRLPAHQHWCLVDNDPVLLATASHHARTLPASVTVATWQADLQHDIESVVALEADLLTASAFLDLVSQAWLERLVASAARHRRPVYIALSYDGRTSCEPPDPFDDHVLAAFNAHQLGDKGLGGALGPQAGGAAVQCFEAAGFTVRTAQADWRLGEADSALQAQLLEGWHRAVSETGALPQHDLNSWRARRLAALADGRSRLCVGHVDLWAQPR